MKIIQTKVDKLLAKSQKAKGILFATRDQLSKVVADMSNHQTEVMAQIQALEEVDAVLEKEVQGNLKVIGNINTIIGE